MSVRRSHQDFIVGSETEGRLRVLHGLLDGEYERRTCVADQLYVALVESGYGFWDHIYPLFVSRDITRGDMRGLVSRGLTVTRGNYRATLKLFGMPACDYKRFLNFLTAHGCRADFREFRNAYPLSRPGRAPVGPPADY